MKRHPRRGKPGRPPNTERERLNIQTSGSRATPDEAYAIYASLGEHRSPFLVHKHFADAGRPVTIQTIKRWHKEQSWEAKVGYAELKSARLIRAIAEGIPENPQIHDLAQAVCAIEDLHAVVRAMARKCNEAIANIEIRNVDELAAFARLMPEILTATTKIRVELIGVVPGLARHIGPGAVIEGSANPVTVDDEGEVLKPEPLQGTGLGAAVFNFAKARAARSE